MGEINEQPIIMPMSNPTHRMECTAEDAQRMTGELAPVQAPPLPVTSFGPKTLSRQVTVNTAMAGSILRVGVSGRQASACSVLGQRHRDCTLRHSAAQRTPLSWIGGSRSEDARDAG